MTNNTIRINTTPNGSDKYLKVKLEQSFDFIEILSLKITQEDAYRTFCSDYGVVVGRVIINSGFGVPNAKVSVFIPIDNVDIDNPNIKGLYPYELVTDKDSDGIRYNLLSKEPETNNPCFTPIGTFPTKRDILDNTDMLDIYQKYYKFTTTTNHAGDFMIFGVPLGTYTIHVDADISDIGIASQRPYDSISQGTPLKMFESPTKYKGGTNLDKLIQLKTVNTSVNVQPFWGDTDNCSIGISRIDIDLNYNITPSALFMGSIFGDHEKNSVNKNCRPRKDMGDLCEQVTGEGTIEMIRETLDGTIESFDINGGRVIDDSGSWAYQIPMNLDYMITDETGELILSEDPNKGIPTRANVRFRIGMDETGDEGRLRTRAKFLVPHNPTTGKQDEIDYEFGLNTKKSSFRNIYWNKIYTVSNFIARYQQKTLIGTSNTTNITGIKNVDRCGGNKTPFPFNRVNVELSPIFFIVCILIKIVAFVIYILNFIVLPIINLMIAVIRSICKFINVMIDILNEVPFVDIDKLQCSDIDDIPCIYVECGGGGDDGESSKFAPGCFNGFPSSVGFAALTKQKGEPEFYSGKDGIKDDILVGLDDCMAFQMARVLGLFQYDFYNDWINGSLYSFLLKYKKKGKSEKFCDYECRSTDNDCHNNYLVDNNYRSIDPIGDEGTFKKTSLYEGVIKRFNNEFYYAATTHDASRKMFATELINIGSVFNCDWQGVPKIQPLLVETTYKMPPVISDLSASTDNKNIVLTTGQCAVDTTKGLFFSINCVGLSADETQVMNIRHICEFGVDLDEFRDGKQPDGIIGASEIDSTDSSKTKLFRDVFYGLNNKSNTWTLNLPYNTNFNTFDKGDYNFVSTTDNGTDYIKFRDYYPVTNNNFNQPKHSYYFYFGVTPGRNGLNKLNQNFFTVCKPNLDKLFTVIIKTVPTSYGKTNDGSVTLTFVNGFKPINYTITGPNNYIKNGISGANNTPTIENVKGLTVGEYIIDATDSFGNVLHQTFVISPAPALYADAFVSKNCTSASIPDGEITISAVGGGSANSDGTYTYVLYNSSGGKIAGPTKFSAIPTIIGGLTVSNKTGASSLDFNKVPVLGSTDNVFFPKSYEVYSPSSNSSTTLPLYNTTFKEITTTTGATMSFIPRINTSVITSPSSSVPIVNTRPLNTFTTPTSTLTLSPRVTGYNTSLSFTTSENRPLILTGFSNTKNLIEYNPKNSNLFTPITNTYSQIPNLNSYLKAGSYTLVISDNANNFVSIQDLIIDGTNKITLSATKVDNLCGNGKTGSIQFKTLGGIEPLTFSTENTSLSSHVHSQNTILLGASLSGLETGIYVTTVTDSFGNKDTLTTEIKSTYPSIILKTGDIKELNKQCESDNYRIKLYITSPYGADSDVHVETRIDNSQFWLPYKTPLKFVDNSTALVITLPSTTIIKSKIDFRISNDTKTCYSNIVTVSANQILLPNAPLTIVRSDATQQKSPYQVKFGLKVSYDVETIKLRGPFILNYQVTTKTHNGSSQVNKSESVTNYVSGTIITANVPMINTSVPSDCSVKATVTDKFGCTSPALIMNIDLPG